MGIPCISIKRGVPLSDQNNSLVDVVLIDFSTLRCLDVNTFSEFCLEQSKFFPSVLNTTDQSDVSLHSWASEAHTILSSDVIWRIPVFGVTVTFVSRSESRRYAEVLAVKFAGGIPSNRKRTSTHDSSNHSDEEDDDLSCESNDNSVLPNRIE